MPQKKKQSLYSLSREPLTPGDFSSLHKELITGTDRSAAIVGSSMVENTLTLAISAHLIASESELEELFYKPTAPLSSFAGKIKMGKSLGIYGNRISTILDNIRRVRNVFAHSFKPLNFEHEVIEGVLNSLPDAKLSEKKLKPLKLDMSSLTPHRNRFLAVCFNVSIVLNDHTSRHAKKLKFIDLADGPEQKRKPLPRISSEPHQTDDQNQN